MVLCQRLRPEAALRQLGLVVATRDEAAALIRGLGLQRLSHQGMLPSYGGVRSGAGLTMVVSGAGPERSHRATEQLLTLSRADYILGVGLSGGLQEDLGLAETILVSEVLGPGLPHLPASPPSAPLGHRVGPVLTLDRVLIRPEEKQVASAYWKALAIDMETSGMARAATAAGRPWGALRSISDPLTARLPLDFNEHWDGQGQPRLSSILTELALNPKLVFPLMAFAANVFRAQARLVEATLRLVEVLA